MSDLMRVVMTKKELESHIKGYREAEQTNDALITPDKEAPSGWSVYVMMNHWDKTIPITVED